MTATVTIPVLGALTLVLFAYTIYSWYAMRMEERRSLRERLDPRLPRATGDSGEPADILRQETLSGFASLNTLLQRFSPAAYLGRRISEAGMKVHVTTVLFGIGFLTLTTGLLLQRHFAVSRPVAMAVGAACGILLPHLYLQKRRRKRLEAFITQLPGALDMLTSSLHAGHSLTYALDVAIEELQDPIAAEFRTVLEEIRLGLSAKEAFEGLQRRVPVAELNFFVLAIVLTREVGGNLSEVLLTLAGTLRERRKLQGQVRALTAQGRASAILLCAIPPGVAFAANLLRPGFIDPLFYHPAGQKAVGVAICCMVTALLMIRRIVRPKELGFT
jgi:tight adherence protein B